MKMNPHENEARNRGLKTFHRLAEQFEEPIAIRLVTENRLARVASRAKMIDGIFKLYAQRPRHCFRIAEPIANVKCLDLTPSFPFPFFPLYPFFPLPLLPPLAH